MSEESQAEVMARKRRAMVDLQLQARGIRDPRVLTAMAQVPRHEFVAAEFRSQAYEDHPIPIGEGQTVSQPYIVAAMLESLSLQPGETVLEIGTGSGYQAALLSMLAGRVYSVERYATLAQQARESLARLGYTNVTVLLGDGSEGLPQHAPYDAIIVAAAAPQIPPTLLSQLREGGRMILPVGAWDAQELQLVRKQQGQPSISRLEGCRFVPLVGSQGFPAGW